MNKLKREYQFFKQQTSNVRVLLMRFSWVLM